MTALSPLLRAVVGPAIGPASAQQCVIANLSLTTLWRGLHGLLPPSAHASTAMSTLAAPSPASPSPTLAVVPSDIRAELATLGPCGIDLSLQLLSQQAH